MARLVKRARERKYVFGLRGEDIIDIAVLAVLVFIAIPILPPPP